MVRKGLRKCIGRHVQLRPLPVQLSDPPRRVQFEWFAHDADMGILVTVSLGNGITLRNDYIHQYTDGTDGSSGTLILTGQIYIDRGYCWFEPVIGKPGTDGPLHPAHHPAN